jgi:hypothetical protein
MKNLEAKHMLEHGITSGRGGATLKLTTQQYEMLSKEACDADSRGTLHRDIPQIQ